MKSQSILGASVTLMGLTTVARLSGYLRDSLIAFRFGASEVTDAFLLAYSVPNLLVGVISGALNSVIVPSIVSERHAGQEDRAWEIIYTALAWMILLTVAMVLVIGALAVPLMHAIAPGFTRGQQLLAAHIVQVLLGFVFFSVVAYFLGSVLNSENRFVYAGLAPILASGAAIVTLLALAHPSILLVAWALLAGSIMQVLLQLVPLLPEMFRHRVRIDLRDPVVRQMGRLSFPILVSSGSQSANVIVDRLFGSLLAAGSITALGFSQRVVEVPNAVFGSAVGTVIYPQISAAKQAGDMRELARLLGRGIRLVTVTTVPVAAILLTLAHPIIDVLFRHGAFSQADAELTALCLQGFALTVIPASINVVLMRVYFTLGKTLYVGSLGTASLLLNAVGDDVLMRVMGAPGIAVATAIVQGAYLIFLTGGLRRILPTFHFVNHAKRLAPILLAGGIGAGATLLVASRIGTGDLTGALVATIAGTLALVAVGEGAALALHIPEALRVLRRLRTPRRA